MKIKTSDFVISSSNYKRCPSPEIPEYAFIGRSNVGKSSLINALLGRKNLAKTSGKPGKTQLINHFIINKEWYLVDLPGFGYTRTSKSKNREFHNIINNYLLNRKNLMCLFLLIDCRHKSLKIDKDFMQELSKQEIPFVIAFTKIDKLGKNILHKNIEHYKNNMLKKWEELPRVFITSAKKKTGIQEILNFIKLVNPTYKNPI